MTTDEPTVIVFVLAVVLVKPTLSEIDFPTTTGESATTVNVLSTVTFGRAVVLFV